MREAGLAACAYWKNANGFADIEKGKEKDPVDDPVSAADPSRDPEEPS